jgi:hypothetical protein
VICSRIGNSSGGLGDHDDNMVTLGDTTGWCGSLSLAAVTSLFSWLLSLSLLLVLLILPPKTSATSLSVFSSLRFLAASFVRYNGGFAGDSNIPIGFSSGDTVKIFIFRSSSISSLSSSLSSLLSSSAYACVEKNERERERQIENER